MRSQQCQSRLMIWRFAFAFIFFALCVSFTFAYKQQQLLTRRTGAYRALDSRSLPTLRRRLAFFALSATDDDEIIGLVPPAERVQEADKEAAKLSETEFDYVIIGSGIGGLSTAALLRWYGYRVVVVESHYLPGGVAHAFKRGGFLFDAGPSLWNGMSTKPFNPLAEILHIVGQGDRIQYAHYDGWVMHTPDGSFKFTVGKGKFEKVLADFGGPNALTEWSQLNEALRAVQELSVAIPPLCLRCDAGALLTLAPHFGKLLKGLPAVPKVEGPFKAVSGAIVKDKFLEHWLDFLSFALSGLPADGTIAAAVAYTMRDLHQERASLDYPIGGGGAVVAALIRSFTTSEGGEPKTEKATRGSLLLNSHVEEIVMENGRAVGVKLRRNGKVLRAKRAVISNASIWDTTKLLPAGALTPEAEKKRMDTPMTGSFVHLHLGIRADGLPADLESHYSVINKWDPIDAPQNHVIISIPSVLDPALAPEGHHVVHAYAAANEEYEPWEAMKAKGQTREQYEKYKEERCDFLWKAIERSIPDVRQRAVVTMTGSPFTHERFNRRYKGTYGPALRAGEAKFPYPRTEVPGLFVCGDSVFPGIGVPAVAASGANAASSTVSVKEHLRMLDRLYEITSDS